LSNLLILFGKPLGELYELAPATIQLILHEIKLLTQLFNIVLVFKVLLLGLGSFHLSLDYLLFVV